MAPAKTQKREDSEFGGAIGAAIIMAFSHVLVYYLWISSAYYDGAALYPKSVDDIVPFLHRMWAHILDGALPTVRSAAIYIGFLAFELLLAYIMPGVLSKGFPVPSEDNKQHTYLCNGAWSWYVTLIVAFLLHYTGLFNLAELADQRGSMLTIAVIVADSTSIVTYIFTLARGMATRLSGNHVYDFFMGAILNPRIGRVDLKFFTEIRVSWMLLFMLSLPAAVKHYDLYGYVSWPLIFILTAHGLYTNACMKGEESVPCTWDIFYEKWGWMLIFWNLVGVPYVYSFNSYYLLNNRVELHPYMVAGLFVALFVSYYVWDSAQAQKNRFRAMERNTYVPRYTFPQMPWGTLDYKTAKVMRFTLPGEKRESTLLVDGWWAYARKIHYTADIIMSLTWALCCGFSGVLPYVYPSFFFGMIMHRAARDEKRCREKYGKYWDQYIATVPAASSRGRASATSRPRHKHRYWFVCWWCRGVGEILR